jgi:hypothetical protein
MSGLLIGYAGIITLISGNRPPLDTFIVLTIGGFAVEGVPLLLWLRYWRRIRRLSPGTKWLLVAGCWGLTILNLLVFLLFAR